MVVIVEARSPEETVQGSGVVYDIRSYRKRDKKYDFSHIVTNAHVVEDSSSLSLIQAGRRYAANLGYIDNEFDLALLYVRDVLLLASPPLPAAQLKVGKGGSSRRENCALPGHRLAKKQATKVR